MGESPVFEVRDNGVLVERMVDNEVVAGSTLSLRTVTLIHTSSFSLPSDKARVAGLDRRNRDRMMARVAINTVLKTSRQDS